MYARILELTDKLSEFASEYSLIFRSCYDDETKTYHFCFHDKERTWGFYRYFTEEQFNSYRGSVVDFVEGIIHDLRIVIGRLGT